MSAIALQALVGATLVDRKFCEELLNGKRLALLAEFDLADEEREAILSIKANSIPGVCGWGLQVANRLKELGLPLRPPAGEEMGQKHSDKELSTGAFLVECLAWGLLQAHNIKEPQVPVREMIEHPLSIFERLSLLELNLGLYDAAYRSCLNGSRLIVIDPSRPRTAQRTSMARELYVAFCHSPRAAELHWPHRRQPHTYSDLFARCLLMPAIWVQAACTETISLESLAARFCVPVQAMSKRLSEVIHHYHPRPDLEKSLTETLFSLQDPWRDRFLGFVANQATNKMWSRQLPTREEITVWLNGNPGLYQDVRYMLHTWQRPSPMH